MLEIQKYLQNNTLDSLKQDYAISHNRHSTYPNLVQLKYSQMDSKMSERIVQECRGVILDEQEDWKIVSYPFDKFFNHGESNAIDIDWATARIYEKLDGSLMTIYFYDGKWQISSAGLPDATGQVRGQEFTRGELFWNIWSDLGYSMPDDHDCCYIFEMLHPVIKVLVPQTEGNIIFIGARNVKTLQEQHIEDVDSKEWKLPRTFDFEKYEALMEASHQLNPMRQEGYVVVDNLFHRVKIKSPQYVKIGLLKGADVKLSDRYLVNIIQINEGEEFLTYFE